MLRGVPLARRIGHALHTHRPALRSSYIQLGFVAPAALALTQPKVLQSRSFAGMMGTTDNPGGMKANASVEELTEAFPTATIIDVRGPDEVAKGPAVPGSLNLVWDREAETMPLDGLPEDKSVPLFVH